MAGTRHRPGDRPLWRGRSSRHGAHAVRRLAGPRQRRRVAAQGGDLAEGQPAFGALGGAALRATRRDHRRAGASRCGSGDAEMPKQLAILEAACALAAGALPEREPHPDVFAGLTRLLAGIDIPGFPLPALVRWELDLLRELGFGLDFSAAAGGNDRLAYVSPRTGRAVTLSQAGEWVDRLLKLPEFLLGRHGAGPCRQRRRAAPDPAFPRARRVRQPPSPPSNGARASL